MHVGFSLLTLFPGRVGGSETNVRGLLREYAAGNGPEHVTVLANRHVMPAYRDVEGEHVALHHVRSYRPGHSAISRLVAMQAARLMPRRTARDVPRDLDLIHYPVTVPIPRADAPTIVQLADVVHHDMPHLFSRAERLHRRWAYDDSARRATMVVTASEYSRQSIARHVGLDPERIEVIPLGIDQERFSAEPGPDDARLALPERFVVYPANLWPHKNHTRLIEALARVADPELSLVLTGALDKRWRALRSLAARLGVERRVVHLGYVEASQMPVLYRRATALVFPSLFEGFGSPPLEAMACGCAVASSHAGSLAEVCDDAALIFNPDDTDAIADAIDRISQDEERRRDLSRRGLERARAYTWAAAARSHVALYERVARAVA